jgi:hypothetical protein
VRQGRCRQEHDRESAGAGSRGHPEAGAAHVLHFVPTSDQVCLERIARRNGERPEGSHHLTEEDFTTISSFFEAPEQTEGLNVKACVK